MILAGPGGGHGVVMSAPNTTEQATVTIPGARVAPDAYVRADARAAEAMPGSIHPLGPIPAEHLGKAGTNFSIASSVRRTFANSAG